MYQLIISAIVHGLHYHALNTMINDAIHTVYDDFYKADILSKYKRENNRLFYRLSVSRNTCFLKYKLFNFEGKYSELIKLIQDTIADDYEIMKAIGITVFNFNSEFTKELKTKKLDSMLLPSFEEIDCIISKNDLLCFLFRFFKKASMLKIIDAEFDVNNYEDLYNFLVRKEMYILANLVSDMFHLDKEKIKANPKKDNTYKRLVDYSFVLLKL